jgi:hypothetical protein
VITNGLMLCGLLNSAPTASHGVEAAAPAVGILLEFAGSAPAAPLNVASLLYGPFGRVWDRMYDVNFQDHPGEYGLSLMAFVIPCLVIVIVNLVF